jgi:hypothetical protein
MAEVGPVFVTMAVIADLALHSRLRGSIVHTNQIVKNSQAFFFYLCLEVDLNAAHHITPN